MQNDESRLITLPNILTLMRLALVPVFLIAYYRLPEARWISLVIFAAAALTDARDGYLARRHGCITSFGKLADPLADKLMVLSMLFCLGESQMLLPVKLKWLNEAVLYLLLAKEIYMLLGGMFMLRRGIVVQSNIVGKAATAVFCAAIVAVFPWHEITLLRQIGQYLVVAAVLLTYSAMVVYTVQSVKALKKRSAQEK